MKMYTESMSDFQKVVKKATIVLELKAVQQFHVNEVFLPSACGRPKGIVVIQASVRPSVTHDYTVNFLTQRFRDIILGQKVAQGL